jgi:hypothetical protein
MNMAEASAVSIPVSSQRHTDDDMFIFHIGRFLWLD